jgi:hypothetical protein
MPVSQHSTLFVQLLIAKLSDDSCWSSFNEKHRYWLFLVELSKMSDFIRTEDLPPEPTPSDNDQLGC